MKPYLLLIAAVGATVVLSPLVACEPSCEDLLNCEPYDNSGGAGGSGGASSSSVGGSGGAVSSSSGGTGGASVRAITAGQEFTCSSRNSSTHCWGQNDKGQLGNGTLTTSLVPVGVAGLADTTSVVAGQTHVCSVLTDGRIFCWGNGVAGQLGDGTFDSHSGPVEAIGVVDAVSVTAGLAHTCSLHADGTVRCWGFNNHGQLGLGDFMDTPTPTLVDGLSPALAISAGGYDTCAVHADKTVSCWGLSLTGSKTSVPVPIPITGVKAIDVANNGYACALLESGQVNCWGTNNLGQLGDGTTTDSAQPVSVVGLTNAVQLSTGGAHNCVLLADDTMRCWGSNGFGQLGNGSLSDALTPTVVALPMGSYDVGRISAGHNHTCVSLVDGESLFCWGSNETGALGDGTTDSSSEPQPVAPL